MEKTAAWRSSQTLILATVTVGFFTDFFLYGIVVPVFPFLLRDRLAIPEDQIQNYSSGLLASYAAAAVFFSVPAGWIADRINSRRWPFLCGLILLLASTITFALGRNIIVIMFARAFQGMSAAVVWTVGFAMVHDTVPSENMGEAIGTVRDQIYLSNHGLANKGFETGLLPYYSRRHHCTRGWRISL
jgi:MFS family permease